MMSDYDGKVMMIIRRMNLSSWEYDHDHNDDDDAIDAVNDDVNDNDDIDDVNDDTVDCRVVIFFITIPNLE